jgi:hypothetical protein
MLISFVIGKAELVRAASSTHTHAGRILQRDKERKKERKKGRKKERKKEKKKERKKERKIR